MGAEKQRKIIHCDCDCFYASIEVRDRPELRGRPVAVGGASERRGVIATCNYEARRYGVHSAMASATALRLCPDLLILPPDMTRYRRVSAAMHEILSEYTDRIEPLSLDEAYLDVTDSGRCRGSATLMAGEIRRRVRETLGITLSAGIAPNKFLAKIASDWEKPDGQFVITPEEIESFVRDLPVKKLFGVGRVTEARLTGLGIRTCQDMRELSEEALQEHFGRFGTRLYELCRGIDRRTVTSERIRKSLSVETTYPRDLASLEQCLEQLPALHGQMSRRLQAVRDDYRISKKFIKLKFGDFVSTTVERGATDSDFPGFPELLRQAWERGERPVRLIGVGVRLQPLEKDAREVRQLALAYPEPS